MQGLAGRQSSDQYFVIPTTQVMADTMAALTNPPCTLFRQQQQQQNNFFFELFAHGIKSFTRHHSLTRKLNLSVRGQRAKRCLPCPRVCQRSDLHR